MPHLRNPLFSSLLCTFTSFPVTEELRTPHGMRQAPECLVPGHISVRMRELFKAGKRRFYRCSPYAGICPGAISTYNTAGRREAIVSTCSPLLNRFMIKVSTPAAANLFSILVAFLGRSAIKLQLPYCCLNRYFPLPNPETGSMIPCSAISFKSSEALDAFISSMRMISDRPKIV